MNQLSHTQKDELIKELVEALKEILLINDAKSSRSVARQALQKAQAYDK